MLHVLILFHSIPNFRAKQPADEWISRRSPETSIVQDSSIEENSTIVTDTGAFVAYIGRSSDLCSNESLDVGARLGQQTLIYEFLAA